MKKSSSLLKGNASTFGRDVLDVVCLIPFGRVTTYGAIAAYLGSKKSSRTVGWILNSVKGHSAIPAHRVVNRFGLLTGKNHFKSPTTMQEMLESEGINIENDLVVDFENYFGIQLQRFPFKFSNLCTFDKI